MTGDSVILMFHVKHENSGIISSGLSPPSGENTRGGGTGGILRYVHDRRVWDNPLLAVRGIVVYAFTARSGQHRV